MRSRLVLATVLGAAACAPTPGPAGAALPPEAATASAMPSLAGVWTGSITCYAMEFPLTRTIDAARPGVAALSKGQGGAVTWTGAVAVDAAARRVTVVADGPADGAERLDGVIGPDGATIQGTMDRQLCAEFALRRGA